ncbi:MAG: hypothetical protein J3Q66DRAFT_375085 [Benniella sp.]|nr:MAG: hypothetical protein J3Q66DRAFT_375085 [Benniella sp.]
MWQWITSMVSVSPQPLTRLKKYAVEGISLPQQGMSALIEAIDLSALEELYFLRIKFSEELFKTLVDRIADDGAPSLPLEHLIFTYIVSHSASEHALRPQARINGTSWFQPFYYISYNVFIDSG